MKHDNSRCQSVLASWYVKSCLVAVLLMAAASQPRAEISVVDDLGQTLVLEKPAKRIVALAPHLVEMVYAVGEGDKMVGAVSYSDYPLEAKALPRVGTYKAFSSEAILRLKPDLVLAWYSGNGLERVDPIKNLGIPVFFTEPRKLEDIGRVMGKIGELTASTTAAAEAEAYRARLHLLRSQYEDKKPLSVFYQVWNQPLTSLNGKHLISDVIRLCGGRNIFADAVAFAPKVSVESILRLNPDVIVASGMAEERPDWLDEWRAWPSLKAVQNEQLKFVPPDIIQRHTPRILLGASQMCSHLQAARAHYEKAQP